MRSASSIAPSDTGTAPRFGLWGWGAVVAALLLIDVVISRGFVPTVVAPAYYPAAKGLRDRTAGNNLGILFAIAARSIATDRSNVIVIGDSTVSLGLEREPERLATMLRTQLAQRDGLASAQVFDFSAIGLPVGEAAVVVAEGLAMGADLVLYAITPRIICALDQAATDARRYVFDRGVTSRLGFPYLLETYSLGELAESAVRSHWHLLAYRKEISETLVDRIADRVPRRWRASVLQLRPAAYVAPLLRDLGGTQHNGPLWTRAHCPLDEESEPIRGLRRILAMCQASSRCLLYLGPLNPAGAASFAPGLAEDFGALVTRLAARYEVPLADYRNLLTVDDFRKPNLGHVDAIHMEVTGRQKLAAALATNMAPRLVEHQL
jgi:hypothetical protein